MNLTVTTAAAFSEAAAQEIIKQVQKKPDSVMCFATGDTTKPIFDAVVRLARDVDFSGVFGLNLDEYVGVSPHLPESCAYRIRRDLYDPLGITRFYIPSTTEEQAECECRRFEELIERLGGIDFVLLSVGTNGHIAFNEPHTPFDSGVRVAEISRSTVAAKAGMFGGAEKVPPRGVTMGIATIMRARHVLLVANGAHKAHIMRRGLLEEATTAVPMSALQSHSSMCILLDEDAASELNSR